MPQAAPSEEQQRRAAAGQQALKDAQRQRLLDEHRRLEVVRISFVEGLVKAVFEWFPRVTSVGSARMTW